MSLSVSVSGGAGVGVIVSVSVSESVSASVICECECKCECEYEFEWKFDCECKCKCEFGVYVPLLLVGHTWSAGYNERAGCQERDRIYSTFQKRGENPCVCLGVGTQCCMCVIPMFVPIYTCPTLVPGYRICVIAGNYEDACVGLSPVTDRVLSCFVMSMCMALHR